MSAFPGRLAIQQRVLTPYRAVFFDTLAGACPGGLAVCAGQPRPGEAIAVSSRLAAARFTPLANLHLLGGPLYLCYQAGLPGWLRQEDPAALILEANPRYLASPAALRWMKQRSRPVLGWGLGAPPAGGALAALRTARRAAFLCRFDALLTYSQRGAEEYAALGFPRQRIFVAPNAAVPRPAHPLPLRPQQLDRPPGLLFVGRLQKRKRLDDLLRACAALPPDLQPGLVIVGDGPERPALQALAAQIYPQAEFPGARHGADLVPYFLAAELFVLPGTGGLAVQEAMSWGLPVVMGQGDGTNDDLVRPENGWQLPDPASLGQVLRSALADLPRLRRMGAASYRIVAQEINLENMVSIFLQALESTRSSRAGL